MSDSNKPTGVIAVLVLILIATVGLFGAEAWNRSHRGQTKAAPASITPPAAPAAAQAPESNHATSPGLPKEPKPSPSRNGKDVLING